MGFLNAVFIKTGSDIISKNYKISDDKFNSEKWMSGFSDLSVYISLSVSRRIFIYFVVCHTCTLTNVYIFK